tara:strand:- start:4731 stop:4988 length:258 start_codon:yes stop_codon:yes gene_type:complete
MKIRVFGASDCSVCQKQTDIFDRNNISYSFVDALADDTQDFCDKHGVDELPHVQVIELVGGKIILNKVGLVSSGEVKKLLLEWGR